MATQEEINKYVEQLIQERAIEAKIDDIKSIIPGDLEKELDVQAAWDKRMALYNNHSHLTYEEYVTQANKLIKDYQGLKAENEAIQARNALKTTAANATIQADKAALEEKAIAVKEANAEVFKAIAITDAKVP